MGDPTMFIHSLTLEHYLPFLLRGVKRVHINFTSIYQLIIGTNGTGKSSILRQLSPLPAEKTDFGTHGFKEIVISHQTNRYRLVSNYTEKGGRHEFWLNEVNLNDGGTITSQRELVYKHFAIDNRIYALLIGQTKFTDMSAIERRNWLLNISGMNLDYAMDIYERLRVKTRDSANLYKHYLKRYNHEVESLPTDEIIQQYQERVDELNAIFLDLNKSKDDSIKPKQVLIEEATALATKLLPLVNKLSTREFRYGVKDELPLDNDDYANYLIKQLEQHIQQESQNLTQLQNELYSLNIAVEEINKVANQGCTDIQGRMAELQDNELALQKRIHYLEFTDSNLETIAATTDALLEDINEILTTIPPNVNRRFSQPAMVQLVQCIEDTQLAITRLQTRIDTLSHLVNHANHGDKTTCPSCQYTWVVGAENVSVEQAEKEIEELAIQLNSHRLQLEDYTATRELYELYSKNISRLNRLYSTVPILQPLFKAIADEWSAAENIGKGLLVVNKWLNDIKVARKLVSVRGEIRESKKAYDVIVGDYEGRLGDITNKHALYSENIEKTITAIESEKKAIKRIRDVRAIASTLEKHKHVITEGLEKLESITKDVQKAIINDSLDGFIEAVRTDLAEVVTLLNKARNAKAVVEKLKIELDHSDKDHVVSKLLVKLISPTDGLIAEKLSLFITNFVEQINYIISQIWAHEFYLTVPNKVNNELDYIFPTKVANSAFFVPDVSRGSSSQVDIVNFAFRLVVMLYMGLSDYPIYLDELAPSLDETHRTNIISFIKEFVDARQCSQMFMISHYVANHGVFTQAEICVTDKKNILTLPANYNQHAVFM